MHTAANPLPSDARANGRLVCESASSRQNTQTVAGRSSATGAVLRSSVTLAICNANGDIA